MKKTTSESFVRGILDEILNDSVSKAEKSSKKHAGDSVSDKTVQVWKEQFPWLQVIGSGKDRKLKCETCVAQSIRSIWSNEGSSNFQRNSIKRHAESNEHQKAEAECTKSACLKAVSDSDDIDQNSSVSSSDEKLFRIVFYAASSELPSSQINGLLKLQSLNGVDIKYQNLSWDTITEIQSCISRVFQKEIVSEIIESEVYAVLIDESTDLTVHKHLSVCVRYVKSGEAVTKFLTNVDLDDGKAHTIVSELIHCLTKIGLDASKIVSLATDGASTMTGKKTGVGVQMKSKHSPFVVQSHCIAHRLNLAVTDSIKKETVLVKFKEKFSALYHFMNGSSNRTVKLKKIQDMFMEPNLTIKEPYSIRWLGLRNAVVAVYDSYSSVIATLSSFAAEKNATANGLHKYFTKYKTAMLVSFMLDVHEVLAFLSKEFQKDDIAFSEINPLLEAALGKLDFLESNDGGALKSMRCSIEIRTEEEKKIAYLNNEKLTHYSDSSESELLSLRSRYITSLKKNIKNRFRQEDSDIFKHLSVLLEPAVVNSASKSECDEALNAVGLLYGEDKSVKIISGDIQEGITEEKKTVKNLLNKDKLIQEWPMVRGMIEGSYCKKSTKKLCKRIILLHGDAFPEFTKLCKIALCMSVSSVACERSFSAQNRIKNKYRSSLKHENLDVLIQIQMSGTDLASYEPTKAVKLWTTRRRRRKNRLTQQYKPRVKAPSVPLSSKRH